MGSISCCMMTRMLTSGPWLTITVISCLSPALADYHYGDYVQADTYIYPNDTSLLSTYQDYRQPLYHNQPTERSRRTFDQGLLEMTASLSFDASIPITDLGTTLYLSMPFYFTFPTTQKASTGRSLSGAVGTEGMRSTIYKGVEKYVSHITGADGHTCLLRAMCEASSIPLHDEGIIGDAVTFLLTTNYASEEEDDRFKKYLAAQAKGQLTGDCTDWHAGCPMSLFKIIEDNII